MGFEEVRLVGTCKELGAWDPAQAVPLTTTDRQYPLWRSAEVSLPKEAPEPVMYKYVMVFSGSVVYEAGPNRVLQPSTLQEGVANLVEDVLYDLDDSLARRNSGVRIRFHGALERGQLAGLGLDTSRFASSVPSPLRTCSAGQTPVDKSPRGVSSTRELEGVLRELVKLEAGRPEVRRAADAVRAAIEAERGKNRSRFRSRGSICLGLAFAMVPLLPVLVGGAILWRLPSSRGVTTRRALPWMSRAILGGEASARAAEPARRARRRRKAARRDLSAAAEQGWWRWWRWWPWPFE